jgi:hypothetical protein
VLLIAWKQPKNILLPNETIFCFLSLQIDYSFLI